MTDVYTELLQENSELETKVFRLEQENKENIHYLACMTEQRNKLKSALEEISGLASTHCTQCSQIINIINEVLNDSRE